MASVKWALIQWFDGHNVSVMRITSKGQVTIPPELREKYGLAPQSEVEFIDTGHGVALQKVGVTSAATEKWLVDVRGITRGKMTTDEIMRLTRGDDE